jgi:hypothetical protein
MFDKALWLIITLLDRDLESSLPSLQMEAFGNTAQGLRAVGADLVESAEISEMLLGIE